MTDKQAKEIATEAVKIYFDYNVSAEESIAKAKEVLGYEEKKTMEKAN